MSLEERIKRLRNIDINTILNNCIRQIEDKLIEMNQKQMYDDGVMNINNPGQSLQYAKSTIRQKKKRAGYKRTDHITLRWDGDFYGSMIIIYLNNRIIIQARDLKWAKWLEPQDRFSYALGLTEKNKSLLRDMLKPLIIEKLKSVTWQTAVPV